MVLFLSTGQLKAQVINMPFPQLEGETITDEKIIIPVNTKGKFTLLGMAYSKKSEDDLETWFQPVFEKFIQESDGLFSAFTYDVNVYFIPMFTGVKAAGAGAAKNKAAKNIDPNLHPYILFYKGDLKTYKDALDFEKKDIPYFFVLDKDGKIIYATSGAFSQDKMSEIEAVIE
ncbi:MAG: hypothetical protein ACNS60_16375 [Candidatus Cyclobacteriaceae bacterium M2_1C_046]